jgi:hypothetical protein
MAVVAVIEHGIKKTVHPDVLTVADTELGRITISYTTGPDGHAVDQRPGPRTADRPAARTWPASLNSRQGTWPRRAHGVTTLIAAAISTPITERARCSAPRICAATADGPASKVLSHGF